MKEVEFRWLQVSISPFTMDRVTVGLVHWDGSELRKALSMVNFPRTLDAYKSDFESSIRASVRRAAKNAEKTARAGQCSFLTLDDVFPVRSGEGSALQWSHLRRDRADDPSRHFELLKNAAGLTEQHLKAQALSRAVTRQLVTLGQELIEEKTPTVRVKCEVQGRLHSMISPVSWQNGTWNHTIVADFHTYGRHQIRNGIESLAGKLDLAVPDTASAVVMAIAPQEEQLASLVEHELDTLKGKHVSIMLRRSGDEHGFGGDLRQRILLDTMSHQSAR